MLKFYKIIKQSLIHTAALFLIFACIATNNILAQDVTGLNGWSLFIDPGHSTTTENQGAYGYSEPEKVLRVGLALKDMLLTQTDIDTVYMSRTDDIQEVTLSDRTDLANTLAADFYYSIHSNAGSSTANNTLMLYGGWRTDGVIIEKTPNGGRAMGDYLIDELTAAMRIPTIGNFADRTFYDGSQNHSRKYPYLHVNRESEMASVLSEGGFHTNPVQQTRNLNAEWKRLEAQAAFWSILRYMSAERPTVGIATGFITDAESGSLLNGVTVNVGGKSYTTDTFESLFNKYSNEPGELRNGFYYIEELPNETLELITGSERYYSDTLSVTVLSDNFTFTDIQLTSKVPPYVISTFPVAGDTTLNPGDPITLHFSRPMNETSVAAAFTANGFNGEIYWTNESTMNIRTDSLDFETTYSFQIDSSAVDASSYAHHLDADSDGSPGGVFDLSFKTGPQDIAAPVVVDVYPISTRRSEVLPIISVTMDEEVASVSITTNAVTLKQGEYQVPGELKHKVVNDQSIFHFFPSEKLTPSKSYTITISGALEDEYGNQIGSDLSETFLTGSTDIAESIILDDFESGVNAWWAPDQSGSSNAFLTDYTSRATDGSYVNALTGSDLALRVNYGWDTSADGHLIREYHSGTTPAFTSKYILQTYVFGDGNGNQFRFVVADDSGYEASDWYTVDWIGWRLVSWDMTNDPVHAWVNGDGTITGTLDIDSYQLTYTEGQPNVGFIVFDDLRAVKFGAATSTEELAGSDLPKSFTLNQNYPNPFNPTTNIRFGVPQRSQVNLEVYDLLGRKVMTLFNGVKPAGFHTISFDASGLSSGIYLYRLTTGKESISKKMLLMK